MSFLQQVKLSLKSSWKGVLLFFAAVSLLWWNEGRAVRMHKSINDGRGIVMHVDADSLNLSNNLKLVHLTGATGGSHLIEDKETGQRYKGFKLKRNVETLQWKEVENENSVSYTKKWSSELINSDEFEEPNLHYNPKQRLLNNSIFIVKQPSIGAFYLGDFLVDQIKEYKPYELVHDDKIQAMGGRVILGRFTSTEHPDYIYLGSGSLANPEIGDTKIWYQCVRFDTYSVIAQQKNGELVGYTSEKGAVLNFIELGSHSADEMFDTADSNNTAALWIVRSVGLGMMFAAFNLMFDLVLLIFSKVPILNRLVEFAIALVAGIFTAVFGGLTIGLAWIYYRPIVGSIILIFVLSTIIIFYKKGLHRHIEKQRS